MTTSVDNRPHGEAASYSGAMKSSSVDNRQGWLKALEAAGLRDALQNTRAFAGSEGQARYPENESETRRRAPAVRQLDVAEPFNGGITAQQPCAQAQPGFQEPATIEVTSHAESELPAGIAAQQQSAEPTETGAGQQELSPASVTGDPANAARRNWAARNLLLLPAEGGGVEIWVRDAKLSGARMQMLLSDLRRTATELGGGPVQLFVNGRPVVSADNGHTRQGE